VRALVVYESMFGNTARVAEAVAAGLSEHASTRLHDVRDAAAGTEEGVDLIVVGGPTHAFSMSRASTREEAVRKGADPAAAVRGLREWLAGLGDEATPVATFDTRVARGRRFPGSAARRAATHLRRRGHPCVSEPTSFFVEDTGGPLLDGELERARSWGAALGSFQSDQEAVR
jgi:flavodoxin